MNIHFIVISVAAYPQGWRFFAGLDEAEQPIWGEASRAVQFPTFKQASRIAHCINGAQVCASIHDHRETIQ